jgi:predicted ATP-binding protein involved in virulence
MSFLALKVIYLEELASLNALLRYEIETKTPKCYIVVVNVFWLFLLPYYQQNLNIRHTQANYKEVKNTFRTKPINENLKEG